MPTSYPGSLDSLTTSIAATDEMDDSGLEHDLLHNTAHGAINAVEAKVGTGASTAVNEGVLGGTGSGTSAWTTGPTLAGTVTAAAFAGPLTGNVTGNASGTALTVTQAAQSAITSVGTLTSATISGDLTVDTSTLKVDSSNNRVGIGTTAPNNSLSVGIATASPVPNVLKGLDVQYGTETKGGVQMNPSTGEVRMGALNSTGDYFVTLYADNAEAMRIDKDGNVGIGFTAPSYKLAVNGAMAAAYDTNTTSYLGRAAVGYMGSSDWAAFAHIDSNTTSGWALIQNSSGRTAVNSASGQDLAFAINNVEKMTVDSGGNVGIGTTSPVSALEIASDEDLTDFTSTARGALTISNTDYNSGDYQSIDFRYNTSTNPNARVAAKHTGSGSYLSFGTSNNYGLGVTNEAMVIDYLGNVGIGTPGPTYRFQVAHPGTSAQGYFEGGWDDNLNSNSRLIFTDGNFGIGAGQIGSGTSEDHLVLYAYNGAGRGVSIKGTSAGSSTTFQSMDKWATFTHHTWGPRLTLYGSGTTEGGELALAGGSSYGDDLYIDRHDNTLRMIYDATSVFQIASNGDVTNVNDSYGVLSDERLKTDIAPARNYLADLLNLEVVNFVKDKQFVPTRIPVLDDDGNPTYRPVPVLDDEGNMTYDADGVPITTNGDAISDPSPTEGAFEALDEPGIKQLGLIAQQVEAHIPGLVSTDEYGVKALKSSILVPMLLQAVQILTARVTELESA